ncbi:MAG: hypothetical protein Q9170_005092, partial [Blastenia crenularia]
MRSRTGCLTCRRRKLKCDEQKPVCNQCQRAKRDCQPCDAVVFRHQQNASMNSTETEPASSGTLDRFYAYKDTFDQNSVWVDVPKTVTFVNISDPYAVSSNPEIDELLTAASMTQHEQDNEGLKSGVTSSTVIAEAHGRELDALPGAGLYKPPAATAQPKPVRSTHGTIDDVDHTSNNYGEALRFGTSPHTAADLAWWTSGPDLLRNPASTLLSPTNQHLEPPGSGRHLQDAFRDFTVPHGSHSKGSTETNQKTAFLLRRFSEVTGRWMDLYDQTTFFGSYIPVKSISNPLLKHAACAYAAKQLGRVNGAQSFMGMLTSHQPSSQRWEGSESEDWALLAAEYYDNAISLLMEALQWDNGPSADNSSEEIDKRHYAPRTLEGMVEERKLRRRQFGSAQSTARSDDLLAATAILCEYESLDASNSAWAYHLSGTKSLLDVVEVGMMPFESPDVPVPKRKPSQARKATFWNFARQDLFAAFVHECRTRLDTEDVAMWRDAGLMLDGNDLVIPSNTPESIMSDGNNMREDMMGNALIWLVSKLMNLLCANDNTPATTQSDGPFPQSSSLDRPEQSLSEKWTRLTHELEVWFTGLPETFMPSAILPTHPHGANLTEVWSSLPTCSATIMTWHMAQVLILVNKPPDVPLRRPTVAERVKS